jgi:DNA-binding NtrC family response regulator
MEESMEATVWENEETELTPASHNGQETVGAAPDQLRTLKELTLQLLREVQCIGEVRPFSFEDGLDFYNEVSRFEIDLIERALFLTAGHQGRAARLLNLRATTLNSKIKHYGIDLDSIAAGFSFLDRNNDPGRQQHV